MSRLLQSENVDLAKLKQAAYDDIKRRWAHRDRMLVVQKKQEAAIAAQVKRISEEGGFAGAMTPERAAKLDEAEEQLQLLRKDVRKVFNAMEDSREAAGRRIEVESRKLQGELNGFKNLFQQKVTKDKETSTAQQADAMMRFSEHNKRLKAVEEQLEVVVKHQSEEVERLKPLHSTQEQLVEQVARLEKALASAEGRLSSLERQIGQSVAATEANIQSNERLEAAVRESSEYYDVELRYMRHHVSETLSGFAEMRRSNKAFGKAVSRHVVQVTEDLNRFVMKLPTAPQLLALCQRYESLWVRLHHEGAEGSPDLSNLPDLLHDAIASCARHIAHHVADAATRLVLARWVGAFTGRKIANSRAPPAAPAFTNSLQRSNPTAASSNTPSGSVGTPDGRRLGGPDSRTEDLDQGHNGTDGGGSCGRTSANVDSVATDVVESLRHAAPHEALQHSELLQNMTASLGGTLPVAPGRDLVEQVREELLQKYLAGFVALLQSADRAGSSAASSAAVTADLELTTPGPESADAVAATTRAAGLPGLLRSNARATFQRKLRRAIDIALTAEPLIADPTYSAYNSSAANKPVSRGQSTYDASGISRPVTTSDRFAQNEFFCMACSQSLAANTVRSGNGSTPSRRPQSARELTAKQLHHARKVHAANVGGGSDGRADTGTFTHATIAMQSLSPEAFGDCSGSLSALGVLTLRDVLTSNSEREGRPNSLTATTNTNTTSTLHLKTCGAESAEESAESAEQQHFIPVAHREVPEKFLQEDSDDGITALPVPRFPAVSNADSPFHKILSDAMGVAAPYSDPIRDATPCFQSAERTSPTAYNRMPGERESESLVFSPPISPRCSSSGGAGVLSERVSTHRRASMAPQLSRSVPWPSTGVSDSSRSNSASLFTGSSKSAAALTPSYRLHNRLPADSAKGRNTVAVPISFSMSDKSISFKQNGANSTSGTASISERLRDPQAKHTEDDELCVDSSSNSRKLYGSFE